MVTMIRESGGSDHKFYGPSLAQGRRGCDVGGVPSAGLAEGASTLPVVLIGWWLSADSV